MLVRMSAREQRSDRLAGGVPEELRSPRAKLVYLYLNAAGECSIDDLQRSLDLQKITLFSILDTLKGRGLVERDGDRFVLQG